MQRLAQIVRGTSLTRPRIKGGLGRPRLPVVIHGMPGQGGLERSRQTHQHQRVRGGFDHRLVDVPVQRGDHPGGHALQRSEQLPDRQGAQLPGIEHRVGQVEPAGPAVQADVDRHLPLAGGQPAGVQPAFLSRIDRRGVPAHPGVDHSVLHVFTDRQDRPAQPVQPAAGALIVHRHQLGAAVTGPHPAGQHIEVGVVGPTVGADPDLHPLPGHRVGVTQPHRHQLLGFGDRPAVHPGGDDHGVVIAAVGGDRLIVGVSVRVDPLHGHHPQPGVEQHLPGAGVVTALLELRDLPGDLLKHRRRGRGPDRAADRRRIVGNTLVVHIVDRDAIRLSGDGL